MYTVTRCIENSADVPNAIAVTNINPLPHFNHLGAISPQRNNGGSPCRCSRKDTKKNTIREIRNRLTKTTFEFFMARLHASVRREFVDKYNKQNKWNQKQFCEHYKISETAFCKWKRKYNDLCRASPNAMNIPKKTPLTPTKEALLQWAVGRYTQGKPMDMHVLLKHALKHAPRLFQNTHLYHSRYMAVHRLFQELLPRLQSHKMEIASSALLQLRSRVSAVPATTGIDPTEAAEQEEQVQSHESAIASSTWLQQYSCPSPTSGIIDLTGETTEQNKGESHKLEIASSALLQPRCRVLSSTNKHRSERRSNRRKTASSSTIPRNGNCKLHALAALLLSTASIRSHRSHRRNDRKRQTCADEAIARASQVYIVVQAPRTEHV